MSALAEPVYESYVGVPRGAVDFLRHLRDSGPSPETVAPPVARTWCRRQGYAAQVGRTAGGATCQGVRSEWVYGITRFGLDFIEEVAARPLPVCVPRPQVEPRRGPEPVLNLARARRAAAAITSLKAGTVPDMPAGIRPFLVALRSSKVPLACGAASVEVRRWCRRHGLVQDLRGGAPRCEITAEGRTFINALTRLDRRLR